MPGGYTETTLLSPGSVGRYKVRVVQREDGQIVLDIREYVENETFTGFTKRGIRLYPEESDFLRRLLGEPVVVAALEGRGVASEG